MRHSFIQGKNNTEQSKEWQRKIQVRKLDGISLCFDRQSRGKINNLLR